jgi:FtsP/CotA-like multicopper oxidase with cupredoxin domain
MCFHSRHRNADPRQSRLGGDTTAMKESWQKLHRDLPPTTLWGYDGQHPGPTIEAGPHQPVEVR